MRRLACVVAPSLLAFGMLAASLTGATRAVAGEAGIPAPQASAVSMRPLVDGTGARVMVPARPARVVVLAPDLAEIAAQVGASEALAGRCDDCDRPETLKELPSVGPLIQPSAESILALRPDLVLASSQGNPLETVRRLRQLGVTVVGVAPRAAGLRAVTASILAVGEALGREDDARAVAARLESRIAAVRARTAARPRVRACLLLWTDPLIAAGEGSFLDDLLDAAGAENACAASGRHLAGASEYPRLSREDLLLAQPDLVMLAVHEASPAPFEGWGEGIPAVVAGRVVRLDPDLYLRPTPTLGAAAEALAALVHPEILTLPAPDSAP